MVWLVADYSGSCNTYFWCIEFIYFSRDLVCNFVGCAKGSGTECILLQLLEGDHVFVVLQSKLDSRIRLLRDDHSTSLN